MSSLPVLPTKESEESESENIFLDHNTYIQWFIMKVVNIEVKDDFW